MIDWLINQLQTNQFAQGAIIAAPVTALTYAARELPVKLWKSCKHFVSYDLVFRSDQEEYYYVNKIISETIINEKWSRDFTYDNVTHWDDESSTRKEDYSGISIGYGRHWGRYKGTPVIVHRQLDEDSHSETFKEMLYVTFIGFNNKAVSEFSAEISAMMNTKVTEDIIKVKVSHYAGWLNTSKLVPRPLDTVFTSDGTKEKLVQHIVDFEASREDRISKGLPWHTGILLKGPPGGGKTSLIHAIASHFGKDINFLNLSSMKGEADLLSCMSSKNNWKHSLLVIEDIDAMRASLGREDKQGDQVSLSTLLNALDGFLTPQGLITIATTNHPENLDEALLRAGRFDFTAELGPLEWEEAKAMADLLLPKGHTFESQKAIYVPMMGADLRDFLSKL